MRAPQYGFVVYNDVEHELASVAVREDVLVALANVSTERPQPLVHLLWRENLVDSEQPVLHSKGDVQGACKGVFVLV